jgi:Uma2 family endonuclease
MSALVKPRQNLMTVVEFLAWPGNGTGTRYEWVDGQLRARDAPSDGHGSIHSNVVRLLGNHLHGAASRCRVVIGGGVRPNLRADWNYRIPDIAVTCAPHRSDGHDVLEPKLLIEILSDSNRADTWDNVRNYVTLLSVEEIVLIETSHGEAHILRRGSSGWSKNPVLISRKGPIHVASVDLDLAMTDVYWGTDLAGRIG